MTGFDFIAIAVIAISGGLAVVRGFCREISSIFAIAGAALATLWGMAPLRASLRDMLPAGWLADLIAIGALFVFTYVLIAYVMGRILSSLNTDGEMHPADRWLGFVFGAARGVVLLGVYYIILSVGHPGDRHPDWIRFSATYPLMKATGEAIQALGPASNRLIEAPEPAESESETEGSDSGGESEEPLGESAEAGYSMRDRNGMTHLITVETADRDTDT